MVTIDSEPTKKKLRKADDPRIVLYSLLDSTRETIFKAVELELAQYRISTQQVKIMHILASSNNGMTLDSLAGGTTRELNSISTMIDRMQKKGLVEKIKSQEDQKIYVTLTEKGKDIYNNTITEEAICLIFDTLSNNEKKELADLLRKLLFKARDLLNLDYKPPFLS